MKKYFSIALISLFLLVGLFVVGGNALAVSVDKINICHTTGDGWMFMDTPAGPSLNGHLGHGDFLYTGPTSGDKDNWCYNHQPNDVCLNINGLQISVPDGMQVNSDKQCTEIPKISTLSATKIVCDNESDLPNWGAGSADITANTASDFISQHPNCHIAPWTFEWIKSDNEPSPKNDDATHLSGWTTFTNTDSSIPVGKKIWVREQANGDYLPFTGVNTNQNISAELYCDTDVLNYDNLEWVNTVAEKTEYCVAFNVLKEQPKQCDVVSDTTNVVEEGINSYDAVETWVHSNWYDENLLGSTAKWIWKTLKVENPTTDETKVFVKKFNLNSVPTSATIDVAADNGFILEVNNTTIANKIGDEHNYENKVSYPVTNLVIGENTIRMTVKNFALAGSTPESNPAGALYKLHVVGSDDCSNVIPTDVCKNIDGYQSVVPEGLIRNDAGNCVKSEPEIVCDPQVNLIQNGDFEQPELASGTWDIIPDSNPLLKWLVAWVGSPADGRLGLEIQNNVAGSSYLGSLQHAELDGDHPVTIWQDVPTTPGKTYKLDFAYSPRQGRDALDNEITVKVDSIPQTPVLSVDGTSNTNTVWTPETYSFVATGTTTKVEFTDTGTDTSFGGYLDNINLSCQPSIDPICTEPKVLVDGQCVTPTPVCNDSLALNYDSDVSSAEIVDNTTCIYTPAGQCSDACGQEATTVPDGKGGLTNCPATNACSNPTHRWCVLQEDQSYIAQVIPDNQTNPTGKPWVTGMNAACIMDVCPNIEEHQSTIPEGMEKNSDGMCVDIVTPPARCQYNNDILASNPACVAPRTGGGGGGSGFFPKPKGQVLGASTEKGLSCGIYLNKYIKFGSKNNDPVEVKKLQEFLNEYMGLKLAVTGVYDLATYNAVKAFQVKYQKDVLTPWIPYGLTKKDATDGTGYVYKTTKRLINLIKCEDLKLPIPPLNN